MKLRRVLNKFIFVMFAVVFTTGYLFHRYLFKAQEVVCDIDEIVHADAQQSFQERCAFLYDKHPGSLAKIAQTLSKEFGWVKNIAIERYDSKRVTVFVEVVSPLFAINDKYVMTKAKKLIPITSFYPEAVSNLSKIIVFNADFFTDQVSDNFVDSVPQLLTLLNKRFDITWKSDQAVYLAPQSAERFSVLCSADTIPDKKILDHCMKLKNRLIRQGALQNTANLGWIADIRFSKQIVLYKKKGARWHA